MSFQPLKDQRPERGSIIINTKTTIDAKTIMDAKTVITLPVISPLGIILFQGIILPRGSVAVLLLLRGYSYISDLKGQKLVSII
jgi:hypothetical protein